MTHQHARTSARLLAGVTALTLGLAVTISTGGSAQAGVVATVPLGTAASFGVLASTPTVENTGPTTVNGLNVGISPAGSITGFPPGLITGTGFGKHAADAVAANARSDATTAYNNAAGRPAAPADAGKADLAGQLLAPGVYQGDLSLTGTVTLDNSTNLDAVFIFQASSTLITASSSVVAFTGSRPSCNVFWQVGSSATLGTNSVFVGTVLALTSITAVTGATITGRLLARNGAVTLDTNTINAPQCAPVVPTTTPTTATATTTVRTSTTVTPTRTTTSAPLVTLTPSTITPIITTSTPTTRRTTGTVTTRTTTSPSTTSSRRTTTTLTTPTTTSTHPTTPGLAITGMKTRGPTLTGLLAILLGSGLLLLARRIDRRPGTHRP